MPIADPGTVATAIAEAAAAPPAPRLVEPADDEAQGSFRIRAAAGA